MVGDSVRGSLVTLAVQRLGKIDQAILPGRFLDDSLAQRLSADSTIKDHFEIVPGIVVRGGVTVESTNARSGGVQIIGVGGDWAAVQRGQCILNSELAQALGIAAPG